MSLVIYLSTSYWPTIFQPATSSGLKDETWMTLTAHERSFLEHAFLTSFSRVLYTHFINQNTERWKLSR
ncbi:hypothetical protein D320_02767 [Haloferax sp. BAB-2207]|nr:hypothetical protein D320_02767 [Haloferax sp. BAB-2207]